MFGMKTVKLILFSILVVGCAQTLKPGEVDHNPDSKSSTEARSCSLETQTKEETIGNPDDDCYRVAGGSSATVIATGEVHPTSGCSGLGCVFGYLWDAMESQTKTHTTIEIFYATGREFETLDEEKIQYTNKWADEISYGKSRVSIPGAHEIGEIERPSWFSQSDPDEHVLVQSTQVLPQKQYFSELESHLNEPGSLLVFVHGYNVSFEEAALRTGQMAFDLKFRGVPMFYSWPSKGDVKSYAVDGNTMEWSKKNIEHFLKQLLNETTASNIYLVGHSMGARGLTQAYIDVVEQVPEAKKRIKEVILAAPDIDAKIFKRDIAPKMLEAGAPVTVYVSSRDNALKASKQINGSVARAGIAGDNISVISGIETIDISALGTGVLNHSTFADVRPVINDMYSIIHHSKRAADRVGLESVQTDSGVYWKMRK